MEGDGYVIARICSIVIVILIGSSRNHFPLSSLLCPTIWVGFCLRLYLCGLSREKKGLDIVLPTCAIHFLCKMRCWVLN